MQLQYATMISMLRSCLLRSRHLSPSLVKQCGPVSAQRVMSSANKDQASLTGGHVQYVKGVAEVCLSAAAMLETRQHACTVTWALLSVLGVMLLYACRRPSGT